MLLKQGQVRLSKTLTTCSVVGAPSQQTWPVGFVRVARHHCLRGQLAKWGGRSRAVARVRPSDRTTSQPGEVASCLRAAAGACREQLFSQGRSTPERRRRRAGHPPRVCHPAATPGALCAFTARRTRSLSVNPPHAARPPAVTPVDAVLLKRVALKADIPGGLA